MKLDITDKKILTELDKNSRLTYSQISKKLKIGKHNIQYRIKKLAENKIITKFTTEFALGKLGFYAVKIFFQLAGFSKEKEKEIYNYLIKNNKIIWVAKCEGRWDLMIGVYAKTIQEFNNIKKDFFEKYGKYVSNYVITFLTEAYILKRAYLLDKKRTLIKEEKYIDKGILRLDEKDKKLLKLIANNSRINIIDLAKQLKLNIKTIKNKIKKFEKEGLIQGYTIFLDLKKLNYNFFKLCIYLKNFTDKQYKEFINYCKSLPNIIHLIESLGPWNVELEIETETNEQFYDLVHNIRNKFADIVEKTESVIISEEKKLEFLPWKF